MRIFVLENEPSSRRGGQELSLLDTCRGLAARGHIIDLLYVKSGDLLEQYLQFSNVIRTTPYTVDRNMTLQASTRWLLSLLQRSREARYADLIYANQYHDTIFAGALGALLRKPVVCHLRLPPPNPACWQHRLGIARVTRFIAISEAARENWVNSGFALMKDIDVVYNGIDTDLFKPTGSRNALRARLGISPDAFTVLFIGRFVREKGIDILLKAFSTLRLRIPKSRLLVAGGPPSSFEDRPFFEAMCQLATQLGLGDDVMWLGRRSDVADLCQTADVLAMPSDWPEPFGRTLIEAMACGTPAVATCVGGIPEVLAGEFARWLCPKGDFHAFADTLLAVYHSCRIDPDLHRRCREWVVQNFSLHASISGIDASLQRARGLGRRRALPGEFNTLASEVTN